MSKTKPSLTLVKPTRRASKGAAKEGAAKRTPINGADSTAQATLAASTAPIQPLPFQKLRPQDRHYWDILMRARARDEWGRIELVVAQQLARTQADIAAMYELVDSGDRKRMDDAGFPSVRAVGGHITTLLSQQSMLMRQLRIVGNVVGDPVDEIPRRKAEREAEQTIERLKQGDKAKAKASGAQQEDEEPPLLAI